MTNRQAIRIELGTNTPGDHMLDQIDGKLLALLKGRQEKVL